MDVSDKQRIRTRLLARRRDRSPEERDAARAAIAGHVLRHVDAAAPGAVEVGCVAGYLPMRTEPGSVELLDELAARRVRVLVPILRPDRDLDWGEWRGGEVGPGLGLDAVADAGLVLVPALAAAADGTRLGRGGGSYDRALTRVRAGVEVAALLFEEELLASLPRDGWDVLVGAAVTPSGWHGLGRNTGVAADR